MLVGRGVAVGGICVFTGWMDVALGSGSANEQLTMNKNSRQILSRDKGFIVHSFDKIRRAI